MIVKAADVGLVAYAVVDTYKTNEMGTVRSDVHARIVVPLIPLTTATAIWMMLKLVGVVDQAATDVGSVAYAVVNQYKGNEVNTAKEDAEAAVSLRLERLQLTAATASWMMIK
ncbi:hypothetical protein PInf_005840 [Phytophthora infestans]|nr:hypothetical protein PInf_005840 [Phytophthora infestans]